MLLVCLVICLIVRRRNKDHDAYDAVETAENQADEAVNGIPQGNTPCLSRACEYTKVNLFTY